MFVGRDGTEYEWNKLDSKTLFYGYTWEENRLGILAKTYEAMLELAHNVVEYYKSDLFHDAVWLWDNIKHPGMFEWIIRESGTWIGDIVKDIQMDPHTSDRKYRFVIRLDERERWILDIWEAVPVMDAIIKNDAILQEMEQESWRQHELLPVEQCELAATIAGCIYHPAPFLAKECTGHIVGAIVQHDGDTCPQHENDGSYGASVTFTPTSDGTFTEDDQGNWHPVYDAVFPSYRNNDAQDNEPVRKGRINMDDIIRDLRSKLDEANSAKEELDEFKYEIDNAIDDLDNYISEVDDLIEKLDSLPEVSVSVSIDVDFES